VAGVAVLHRVDRVGHRHVHDRQRPHLRIAGDVGGLERVEGDHVPVGDGIGARCCREQGEDRPDDGAERRSARPRAGATGARLALGDGDAKSGCGHDFLRRLGVDCEPLAGRILFLSSADVH
jgi:hypothetical protein